MTYISRVYEAYKDGWTQNEDPFLIDDDIGGNVFLIPDYICQPNTSNMGVTFATSVDEGFTLNNWVGDLRPIVVEVGDPLLVTGSTIPELSNGWYYVTELVAMGNLTIKLSASLGGSNIAWTDPGTFQTDLYGKDLIGNNVGVAAVGVINLNGFLSGGFLNAYFPALTREFQLIGATPSGTIVVQDGWVVDFAQDLMTPSPVATYGVNKDVFNFNDNDDKRKLATRVVVRGKDINGVSISVSLIGIRAYNAELQFYNGCTYISRKSEGYIYKNNFMGEDKTVDTVNPFCSTMAMEFTTSYAGNPTKIYPTSEVASFVVNSPVAFLDRTAYGNLPSNIISSGIAGMGETQENPTYYYVIANGGTYITVGAAPGGSAIDIGSDSTGAFNSYVVGYGNFIIDNSDTYLKAGDPFVISATSYPGGTAANTVYYVLPATLGTSATQAFNFSKNSTGKPIVGIGNTAGSGVKINKLPLSGLSELGYISQVWLYGWDYAIPASSNLTLSIPGVSTSPIVSVGAPVEAIDSNGVMYTKIILDRWVQVDYGGRGYLMNQKLYVNNKDYVISGSDLTLRFGEEPIEIEASNCGTDAVYGDYLYVKTPSGRVTSASKKAYPHGVGCLVMYPDVYDLDNPEAGSPVALHGERVVDVTVDSNITYGYLDAYATALLLGNGTLYTKATCSGPITKVFVKRVGEMLHYDVEVIQELSRITPPRVGDNIEIVDSYGATPVLWEVMSVTIKYDQGMIDLVLGDFEQNPVTSMIKSVAGFQRPVT